MDDDQPRREALLRRQADVRDLQDEMAGRGNGKIRRFFTGSADPQDVQRREQKERQSFDDQLRLIARMTEADRALDEALRQAKIHERETAEMLQRIRDTATRDASGDAVYLGHDGRGWHDDGHELSPEEMEAIQWRTDAPSWEERQQAGQDEEDAAKAVEDIEAAKDKLRKLQEQSARGEIDAVALDAELGALPSLKPTPAKPSIPLIP